jgi:hypothetical protein
VEATFLGNNVQAVFLRKNSHAAKHTPFRFRKIRFKGNDVLCNFHDATVQRISDEMVNSHSGVRNRKKAIGCDTRVEVDVAKDVILMRRKR